MWGPKFEKPRFSSLMVCGLAWRFSPQMLLRSTELSLPTKLTEEHETPPIANVLLCVRATLAMKLLRLIIAALSMLNYSTIICSFSFLTEYPKILKGFFEYSFLNNSTL